MKLYTGINIQFPISREILSGRKIIETRTYPIPKKYLGVPLLLVETPGKNAEFKSRIVGIVTFDSCYKYKTKSQFYSDVSKHLVDEKSPWAWKDKVKWGWTIESVEKLEQHTLPQKRLGIVFTTNLKLTDKK